MPAEQRSPLARPRVVVRSSDPPPANPARSHLDTLSGLGSGVLARARRPATLRPDVDEPLADSFRDEALRIVASARG